MCVLYLFFLAGVYTENESANDELLFITERHCLSDLINGVSTPCNCGTRNPWVLESAVQVF